MTSRDLEARAKALLKRLRRQNHDNVPLTEFEIRSVLKEIRVIRNLNLSGSLPDDVLARMNRILQQAVSEANKVAFRMHLRILH